jgi:deoxyadenosine/deoxycytidine kinase
MNAPQVIFVNGNIGSGKETIIRHLQEVLTNRGCKVNIILEPVQLWRDSGMLQKLYNGEYFEFKKFAISSRVDIILEKYQEAVNCNYVFIETNLLIDLHVYAQTTLTVKEYHDYFQCWCKEVNRLPTELKNVCHNLFINVAPEICFQRIDTRSRNEESKIKIDYLQKLECAHFNLNRCILPFVVNNYSNIHDNKELKKYIDSLFYVN